ncbi:ABC transporter permease [Mollicutes bacterium LVI A0078]|nr:ABC transporter permease [Mollicutes bacterium LVI A0075]WOO91536.1 ABC transporter permease [Mollicutes bacterium LVI A0078]
MNFVNKYISQLSFVVLIIIWQLGVTAFAVPEYILPSPTSIVYTLITNIKLIAIHTSYTLFEAVLGILIAIVLGVLSAIVLYRYQTLNRIFMPYINILQTIPAIVIAPLFAMWFGFGLFPKVLLIVIFCSFPIVVSTVSSFSQVDSESILYLKSLNCNDFHLFKHLYLPAASKSIFASIKISTTYSLVNAIFAEYMGAKYGLGVYLNKASSSFSTPDVFAIIIVIIVVTLSLLKIVDKIETKVIRWD